MGELVGEVSLMHRIGGAGGAPHDRVYPSAKMSGENIPEHCGAQFLETNAVETPERLGDHDN